MSNDYFNNVSTQVGAGTLARASQVNALGNAIAAAFEMLPGNAALHEDRVNFVASDTGIANAYVAALPSPITSYTGKDGLKVRLRIAHTSTGASTLNIGGGAKDIVDQGGNAIASGAFVAGVIYEFIYDETNDRFIASSDAASAASAQASADAAATDASNAAASASAASTSASNAAGSASAASTSAGNAAASESAASIDASNALASANDASTSASNASTSESNAAASAAAAAASAAMFPSVTALDYIRWNSAGTTLENRTPAQVRADIGAGTGSGDMVSTNNLSDVADAATSLSNIGGMPSADFPAASALDYIRWNAAGTAFENQTPAQVLTDIGAAALNGDSAENFDVADAAAAHEAVAYGQLQDYVLVQEQYSSPSSAPPDPTAAIWNTRALNTIVSDASGLASLASYQVTLAAGIYRYRCRAPTYSGVNGNMVRLQNITDSTTIKTGESNYHGTTILVNAYTEVHGVFTISASKVFELQHYVTLTSTYGFGHSALIAGVGNVYASAEFWKIG